MSLWIDLSSNINTDDDVVRFIFVESGIETGSFVVIIGLGTRDWPWFLEMEETEGKKLE